jgi:hypothetical protein
MKKLFILAITALLSSSLMAQEWIHIPLQTDDGTRISVDFQAQRAAGSSGSMWVMTETKGDIWINVSGGSLRDYKKVSVLFLSEPFYQETESVNQTIPLWWSKNESRFTGIISPASKALTLYARKIYTEDAKRCQSLVVIVDQKVIGPTFNFCMSDYFEVF